MQTLWDVPAWTPHLGDQVRSAIDTSIDGEEIVVDQPHRVVSIHPQRIATIAGSDGRRKLVEFRYLSPWESESAAPTPETAQLSFLFGDEMSAEGGVRLVP